MPILRGRRYDGPPLSELDSIGDLTPDRILAVMPYVLDLLEKEKPCPPCEGRGIVIVAGGGYLKWAFASVSMTRQVTDLPIQIWYLGDHELTEEDRLKFEGLDVEWVNANSFLNDYRMHNWGGWQAKSYAVANCPFREVLLLDADAFPVIDPETIFESEEFTSTGCLMWPDLNVCRADNMIFPSLGILYTEDFHEMEVGQLLIDKQRLWKGVRLAVWMNSHSEAFYKLFFGDKESWQMSFRKLGIPFSVGEKPDWHGWGMAHKFRGKDAFYHAMQQKRGSVQVPGYFSDLVNSYSELQPA